MKKQDHVGNIEYLAFAINETNRESWSSWRSSSPLPPPQSRPSSLQVSRNEEEGCSIVQLGQVPPSKNPAVHGAFPFRSMCGRQGRGPQRRQVNRLRNGGQREWLRPCRYQADPGHNALWLKSTIS